MSQLRKHIEHLLRTNTFYKKHLQGRINAMRYWAKDLRVISRHYRWRKDHEVSGNTVYFIFDPSQKHPGMTDRVKVIVCCYWIAKQNGFDFKVVYDQPHRLSDYYTQAEVPWIADRSELSYSLQNTRLLSYNGSAAVPKLDKRVRQYHIWHYIGINLLYTNHVPEASMQWAQCFAELFRPAPQLQQAFNHTGLQPRQYAAVHFRFVNALEHFEDGYYNAMSAEEQQQLIDRCLQALLRIKEQCAGLPLYVFSDSTRFIKIALDHGYQSLEGNVGHVSFSNDSSTLLKAFLDSYAISQSAMAFRVLGGPMYDSTFPFYASLMGGRHCHIYNIDTEQFSLPTV